MAIQAYNMDSRLTSPETCTAYDRSFTADDKRNLAISVYNISSDCTSNILNSFTGPNGIKEKVEEILDLMDQALVINNEAYLKNKLIYLYENLPKIISQLDDKFINYAIEPSIRYCNQQQAIANRHAAAQASSYRHQVEEEQRRQQEAAQAQLATENQMLDLHDR